MSPWKPELKGVGLAEGGSAPIQRAAHAQAGAFHDMRVNLCGGDVFVSQETWSVRMSVPPLSKWVAKLCRRACGVTRVQPRRSGRLLERMLKGRVHT